ncbi:MAG: hypothetical protein AAFX04_06235 [Pseudomonadota bacterium]
MILATLFMRVGIFVITLWVPFVIFTGLSKQKEAPLVLMLPLFYTLPLTFAALVFLLPLEAIVGADRNPDMADIIIPIVAASIVLIFCSALLFINREKRRKNRQGQPPKSVLPPLLLVFLLGGLWGVLWRMSDWAVKHIGIT